MLEQKKSEVFVDLENRRKSLSTNWEESEGDLHTRNLQHFKKKTRSGETSDIG